MILMSTKYSGSNSDKHVLGASGPVLDVGAGRPAAEQRHDLHEPIDHGPPSSQQEDGQEENYRNSQSQANV